MSVPYIVQYISHAQPIYTVYYYDDWWGFINLGCFAPVVAGGCVGMGDIRKDYLSRAGALPGNGNFHQNNIVIIFFTLTITITH